MVSDASRGGITVGRSVTVLPLADARFEMKTAHGTRCPAGGYEWVGGDGAFPEARALQYFPLRWQT